MSTGGFHQLDVSPCSKIILEVWIECYKCRNEHFFIISGMHCYLSSDSRPSISVSTSFQVHCSVVVVQVLQSLAFLKVLFWSLPDHIVLFFFPYLFTQAVCGMSIGLAITVIGKNRDQVRLHYLKRMR